MKNEIYLDLENSYNQHCTFIGYNAGIEVFNGKGIVIIGDEIRSLDKTQPNVLFLGDKVAIGKTVMGKENTLFQILKEYYESKQR